MWTDGCLRLESQRVLNFVLGVYASFNMNKMTREKENTLCLSRKKQRKESDRRKNEINLGIRHPRKKERGKLGCTPANKNCELFLPTNKSPQKRSATARYSFLGPTQSPPPTFSRTFPVLKNADILFATIFTSLQAIRPVVHQRSLRGISRSLYILSRLCFFVGAPQSVHAQVECGPGYYNDIKFIPETDIPFLC